VTRKDNTLERKVKLLCGPGLQELELGVILNGKGVRKRSAEYASRANETRSVENI